MARHCGASVCCGGRQEGVGRAQGRKGGHTPQARPRQRQARSYAVVERVLGVLTESGRAAALTEKIFVEAFAFQNTPVSVIASLARGLRGYGSLGRDSAPQARTRRRRGDQEEQSSHTDTSSHALRHGVRSGPWIDRMRRATLSCVVQ